MEALITLVVLVVGGYLGWKILLAAWGGLTRFGESIERNLPAFFEKVFISLASGVVAGGIAHELIGNNKITTAGALGGALVSLAVTVMKNGGGSDMG